MRRIREMLAAHLMRLAVYLGAKPPPHLLISVTVDGRPVLLMHDEQAHWQAEYEGGAYKLHAGRVVVTFCPLTSHNRG